MDDIHCMYIPTTWEHKKVCFFFWSHVRALYQGLYYNVGMHTAPEMSVSDPEQCYCKFALIIMSMVLIVYFYTFFAFDYQN